MKRIYIQDTKDHVGKKVTVAGWVDVRRDHGKITFIDLRDKTGILQTVSSAKNESVHETIGALHNEWVVEFMGTINKRPENMVNSELPFGDIEMVIEEVKILGKAHELPFEKDEQLNLDTYLDHLPLTLRSKKSRAIFKVQSEIIKAYRETLSGDGFIEFQSPKLVGGDAEGGGNIFKVEYFNNKDAYLATSPQLYKQIMVGVYERVFTTGTAFRAEKHSTARHLNEYTSLDAEFGFIKDHHDVMHVLTQIVQSIVGHVGKTCPEEFKLLGATIPTAPNKFPFMKLREAQELISKDTGEDVTKESDLEPAHERWLSEYAKKELKSDFLFITHYPTEKRPFYSLEDEEDRGFTKSFDLLFRGVEITTGGQRVHDYETLVKKIEEKKLNVENFEFYLEAFKYGMPPHGGWGMGLERLTQKFLELSNIKEATLFPREINRIDRLLSK